MLPTTFFRLHAGQQSHDHARPQRHTMTFDGYNIYHVRYPGHTMLIVDNGNEPQSKRSTR